MLDCADEPTRLLGLWDGLQTLVVVDALRSGARPGTLRRFEVGDAPLPRELRLASTHAMGSQRRSSSDAPSAARRAVSSCSASKAPRSGWATR